MCQTSMTSPSRTSHCRESRTPWRTNRSPSTGDCGIDAEGPSSAMARGSTGAGSYGGQLAAHVGMADRGGRLEIAVGEAAAALVDAAVDEPAASVAEGGRT